MFLTAPVNWRVLQELKGKKYDFFDINQINFNNNEQGE